MRIPRSLFPPFPPVHFLCSFGAIATHIKKKQKPAEETEEKSLRVPALRAPERVNVDFTSPELMPLARKLCAKWEERTIRLAIPGFSPEAATAGMNEIRKHLASEPEAGAGLLLAVFSTYQAYFHRLSDSVTPIENVVGKKKG